MPCFPSSGFQFIPPASPQVHSILHSQHLIMFSRLLKASLPWHCPCPLLLTQPRGFLPPLWPPNALSLSCTQHVLSSPSCLSLKLVCSWEEPWALELYFLFLPLSACALLNTHLNWMLSFWFPVLRSLWILMTRSQAEWTKKKASAGVRLTSSAVTSSVTWSKFHHHSEPQFLLLHPVCL